MEALLKSRMQDSPGWQSAHEAGYGELLPGIAFVPNLIFQMADMLLDMTPLGPFVNLSDISDFISSGTSSLFGGLIPGLDASKIVSGLFSFGQISGLPDVLGNLEGLFNGVDLSIPGLEVTGIWADAITAILNPLGLMEDLTAQSNSQGVIDTAVQAVFGGGIGRLLSDFADAFQNTSSTGSDAYTSSLVSQNILANRTNRPINGGLERTTVSNMTLESLGTGSVPTNFAVTQTASAIAPIRMEDVDTKGVLYYNCTNSGTITGFYLSFGKMALDGTITPLFQSGDVQSDLTGAWGWKKYVFAGADEIVHNASEVLVVEYAVVGSGTVTIAGQPMAWQTDHPDATTARSGGTRNTQSLGGHPALSNTGFSPTGKTPYVGLGRSSVPDGYIPPYIQTYDAGAFTYTIPSSLRVAGTLVDYWAVGAGGGGQSGGYFLPGQGGECGNWQFGTLVYGVDIPLGTATLTGTTAPSAAGGFNPFIFDVGDNGTSTTIVVPGSGTITATGGTGGGRAGNSQGTDGQAAGNKQITDYIAFGGASAGTNQDGKAPGGGGGCGYPAVGHPSGKGKAWLRSRQP